MIRIYVPAFVFSLILGLYSSNAATIIVNTTNDVINGADVFKSLREAVLQANESLSADVILLSNSTYRLTIAGANEDGALTGDLDITNAVKIVCMDASPATIDAVGLHDRVFHVVGITALFSNLVIRGGVAGTSSGGGLLSLGTTKVDHCTITGNSGAGGGGVCSLEGSLLISNCTIVGNSGSSGANGPPSSPGERGSDGGGIYCSNSYLEVCNSTIWSNAAGGGGGGGFAELTTPPGDGGQGGNGGGIFCANSTVLIARTTVARNNAGRGGYGGSGQFGFQGRFGATGGAGGGIYCASGASLVVSNCTISGNWGGSGGEGGSSGGFDDPSGGGGTGGDGGGCCILSPTVFDSVTIVSNSPGPGGPAGFFGSPSGPAGSPGDKGGLYNQSVSGASLANTILSDNTGVIYRNGYGNINSMGYNLFGATSGLNITNSLTGVLNGASALTGPLAFNGGPTPTHALLLGSPAINAGDPAIATGLDQRGFPRVIEGRIDIGAYEALDFDTDDDGIPDDWEIEYGLDPTNDTDASAHNDVDSFDNLQEYIADTIPTNDESYFHISFITNSMNNAYSNLLLFYYSFDTDEGSIVTDHSGDARTGTVSGATFTPSGYFGGGMQFDGIDDYISVDSGVPISNSSFTLSAWVKPDSSQQPCCNEGRQFIFSLGTASSSAGLQFGYEWNGGVMFAFWDDDLTAIGPYDDGGQWHFWTATYDADANMQEIFRDGVLVTNRSTVGDFIGTGPLVIGTGAMSPMLESFFAGMLDEVKVHGTALTEQEVAALYNAGGMGHGRIIGYSPSSLTRLYTLQITTNFVSGLWSNVANQIDVFGSGTPTNILQDGSAPPGESYYRVRVRLP